MGALIVENLETAMFIMFTGAAARAVVSIHGLCLGTARHQSARQIDQISPERREIVLTNGSHVIRGADRNAEDRSGNRVKLGTTVTLPLGLSPGPIYRMEDRHAHR